MLKTKSLFNMVLMASLLSLSGCGDKSGKEKPETFLQFAFEFAAAMAEEDVADAGQHQERVIRHMIEEGDLESAERYTQRVRSWNRGMAFCQLAAHYFDAGEYEKGESYVLKAENFRKEVRDWPREYISTQIVAALAKGKDMEKIASIGSKISSDENKWISYASMIEAEALNRGVPSALELLDAEYQGEKSFGAIYAHPFALIGIYDSPQLNLNDEEKKVLMERLLPALEAVPGSHFQSAFDAIITRLWKVGDQAGVERLVELGRTRFISKGGLEKTSCLKKTYQARYEAMAGNREEAIRLLDSAEKELAISSGLGFERGAIMAEFLAASDLAQDSERVLRVAEAGLINAYREVNPRPRHMAFSEILMGLSRTSLECDKAMRQRLQAYLDRPYIVIFPEGYEEEAAPDPAAIQEHGTSVFETIIRKDQADREDEGRE